jgi:hypothetical protein
MICLFNWCHFDIFRYEFVPSDEVEAEEAFNEFKDNHYL